MLYLHEQYLSSMVVLQKIKICSNIKINGRGRVRMCECIKEGRHVQVQSLHGSFGGSYE